MSKTTGFVILTASLLALLLIGSLCRANASTTNWPTYYPLMVDQHGNIRPEGYAAGLSEIAAAEAQAAAAAQAVQLQALTTSAASGVVDQVVSALTGAIGFGYVTGHVISFSGAVEVSTNASSQILLLQLGAGGSLTTNDVQHTGHYIWHAYNETMASLPAIKYRTNLNATNAWQLVPYQATAEYHDTTVNGTFYPTVYRSTVYMPTSLDTAFFIAFVEASGGGQAGGYFDVQGGFTINGKRGFTGTNTCHGLVYIYDAGALMSVTNEVAP